MLSMSAKGSPKGEGKSVKGIGASPKGGDPVIFADYGAKGTLVKGCGKGLPELHLAFFDEVDSD